MLYYFDGWGTQDDSTKKQQDCLLHTLLKHHTTFYYQRRSFGTPVFGDARIFDFQSYIVSTAGVHKIILPKINKTAYTHCGNIIQPGVTKAHRLEHPCLAMRRSSTSNLTLCRRLADTVGHAGWYPPTVTHCASMRESVFLNVTRKFHTTLDMSPDALYNYRGWLILYHLHTRGG